MKNQRLKFSIKAASFHFVGSLLVGLIIAILIFCIWFPAPFGFLTGGIRLFGILILVDLVCGPLLTLVLSNPQKSKKEQWFDWGVVLAIQMTALVYGVYCISLARPVAVVFEIDRFVAVSPAEIDAASISKANKEYQSFSWMGPKWLGLREPRDSDERLNSVEQSMYGIEPSVRPDWWQELEINKRDIRQRSHPLNPAMVDLNDDSKKMVLDYARKTKLSPNELRYLPLVSRKNLDNWVVLLDNDGNVVGFAPMSGFID